MRYRPESTRILKNKKTPGGYIPSRGNFFRQDSRAQKREKTRMNRIFSLIYYDYFKFRKNNLE